MVKRGGFDYNGYVAVVGAADFRALAVENSGASSDE